MDSVLDTVTKDNLYSGDYPVRKGFVTIADSQTLQRGAVLGKILFSAGTIVVGGSNTGDGAASAFALAAGGPPIIGNYVATCTAAATDAGTFQIVDPTGAVVGEMEVATTYTAAGITFAIADGAADFIVGDVFTFPVEAGSGQGFLLDIAATDGSQIFDSVLLEAVTTSGATQVAPTAESGEFNTGELTFGGSTVYGDVTADMRDKNCYQGTIVDEVVK